MFLRCADALEKCTLFTLLESKVIQFTIKIDSYESNTTLSPFHVQFIWCKCNKKCQFYYGLCEIGALLCIFAIMKYM